MEREIRVFEVIGKNGEKHRVEVPLSDVSGVRRKYLDLPYGQDAEQKLDLYLPEQGSGPYPVVVYIHGGGFEMGDKREDKMDAYLPGLKLGFAVASFGYRLSRQAPFPAGALDCREAVRWLRRNAQTYGLDTEHIGVIGGSAGGNFAALLAMEIPNGEFCGEEGRAFAQTPYIRAAVIQFPPLDFTTMAAQQAQNHPGEAPRPWASTPEARYIGDRTGAAPDPAACARANPITYVSPRMCPVIVQHGRCDRNVPFQQSEQLVAAIRAKAGPDKVDFIPLATAVHEDRQFHTEPNMAWVWNFFQKQLIGG
jgi:acetyl esterase/lipase